MLQLVISKIKLEFAEFYLDEFLGISGKEEKYLFTPEQKNNLTVVLPKDLLNETTSGTSVKTVKTQEILKDLTRNLEAYLFFSVSSLNALLKEILLDCGLERKKTSFAFLNPKIQNTPECKKIHESILKNDANSYNKLINFFDDDYELLNEYRRYSTHENILEMNPIFEASETLRTKLKKNILQLKRPINCKKIKNGILSSEDIDLDALLPRIHLKIKNLYKELEK